MVGSGGALCSSPTGCNRYLKEIINRMIFFGGQSSCWRISLSKMIADLSLTDSVRISLVQWLPPPYVMLHFLLRCRSRCASKKGIEQTNLVYTSIGGWYDGWWPLVVFRLWLLALLSSLCHLSLWDNVLFARYSMTVGICAFFEEATQIVVRGHPTGMLLSLGALTRRAEYQFSMQLYAPLRVVVSLSEDHAEHAPDIVRS